MNGLGLSAEAIAARRKYVQAGDADRIMRGEWRAVWREKMGLDEGPDLSGVLPVQLGSMTEPFNLAWAEKVTGRPIEYYSSNVLMQVIWGRLHETVAVCWNPDELQVSEAYPWMAANLDGMTTTPQGHRCVVDAKHLGQAYEQEILRYTAAMTHQATVMGCDWWALSCLIGNRKHEIIYQETDPLYQARLIATTREFWTFVERGEEPEDRTEPKPPPKPQPKRREIVLPYRRISIEAIHDHGHGTYLGPCPECDELRAAWAKEEAALPNWTGDFMRLARDFAGTHDAAVRHAITREEIKALVPDDVGKVTFGLVRYGRDGRGAVIALDKTGDVDG